MIIDLKDKDVNKKIDINENVDILNLINCRFYKFVINIYNKSSINNVYFNRNIKTCVMFKINHECNDMISIYNEQKYALKQVEINIYSTIDKINICNEYDSFNEVEVEVEVVLEVLNKHYDLLPFNIYISRNVHDFENKYKNMKDDSLLSFTSFADDSVLTTMMFDGSICIGFIEDNPKELIYMCYNEINEGNLPDSLKSLILPFNYDKNIKKNVLPNLEKLIFSGNRHYGGEIDENALPQSLKILKLNRYINHNKKILSNLINLTEITIPFCTHPIDIGELPDNITYFSYGDSKELKIGVLPNQLQTLTLGNYNYDYLMDVRLIPDGIQHITIDYFNKYILHNVKNKFNIKFSYIKRDLSGDSYIDSISEYSDDDFHIDEENAHENIG